jgi:hypothetical protein
MRNDQKSDFEKAGKEKQKSLLVELMLMLKENKKFWMIPIIIILLGFGLLILLGGTSVAPFIYTLF